MARTLHRCKGLFYEPGPRVRYVLTSILQLVKSGEDIIILDNKTKEDVTGEVLLRAIFHDSRNQTYPIPKALAYDILMNYNGNIAEFLAKKHKDYGPVKMKRTKKTKKPVSVKPKDTDPVVAVMRLTAGAIDV